MIKNRAPIASMFSFQSYTIAIMIVRNSVNRDRCMTFDILTSVLFVSPELTVVPGPVTGSKVEAVSGSSVFEVSGSTVLKVLGLPTVDSNVELSRDMSVDAVPSSVPPLLVVSVSGSFVTLVSDPAALGDVVPAVSINEPSPKLSGDAIPSFVPSPLVVSVAGTLVEVSDPSAPELVVATSVPG
jgi:hypothetical protein